MLVLQAVGLVIEGDGDGTGLDAPLPDQQPDREDEKQEEIARLVKDCQSKLYPAEGMRAFVMPVEEML